MARYKLPPALFAEGVNQSPWKSFTADDKRKGYGFVYVFAECSNCLLYTSPSPRD